MLHCPSSRINLTNSDVADFERRFAARQAAARLAHIRPNDARLGAGPSRLARVTIVHSDDNAARQRADLHPSQTATFGHTEDEDRRTDFHPPRTRLSPPTIRTSDYDDDRTVSGRPGSSPAERSSTSTSLPGGRSSRRSGLVPTERESLSPPGLDGINERHLRPLTVHQTSGMPGPGSARFSRRGPQHHDFVLYADAAPMQTHIEAQHLHLWHVQNSPNIRRSLLDPGPNVPSRRSPSRPILSVAGTPTLLPNLNPGAPTFVPRTRFGSGTNGSEENNIGGVRASRQGGQGTRVSSTQSSSNLRVRSSFERNSQQSYRRRDSHGASNVPNAPVARPAPPQYRRRSHNSDQNANLPSISSIGERYPPLRPPTSIPAPRRNSGSHRQVIFPRRRSSRQHLSDYEQAAQPIQQNVDQRRSSAQSKPSSLAVPELPNVTRAVSPAPSSSSRSTPNLFQSSAAAPLVHSRSSSFSWDRYVSRRESGYRVPSIMSAASGISGSSSADGANHQLGHMPFEESMLSRGSPLDELLLDFSRLFPTDDRPRSVGRSFQRPFVDHPRLSLLSGDIFTSDEQSPLPNRERCNSGKHPLRTANDSSFSEEDAVALSLALPSPNMPSSSPVTTSSPHLPTPPVAVEAANPTPQSSATRSHHSVSTLTPGAPSAATPRVNVYDDRKSPRTQPQTPADISRSITLARTRATTMSGEEVGDVAGGLFSPVIPERRPHRPYTYPAGTPPSMVDGAVMPARTGIVGVRQSLHVRGEQRSARSSENDVEESLVDADRRTWMERREEGSLDVTPPREGRFERYLR
jgi:hypothetical protein